MGEALLCVCTATLAADQATRPRNRTVASSGVPRDACERVRLSRSSFEVVVDGYLAYSKAAAGAFPDFGDLAKVCQRKISVSFCVPCA